MNIIRFLTMALAVAVLSLGCGGGAGTSQDPAWIEAVQVTLTANPPAAAAIAQASNVAAPQATVGVSAIAENVGNVTVRGFIFTNYDGGLGMTPGSHNLMVCQKAFPLKGTDNEIGGANYIFHCYEEEGCDFERDCQQGFYEYYYMHPGEAYCDNAAEYPDLDCTKPTWRVLTIPIFGWAGGGGKLAPGDSMAFGTGQYDYPPGTYNPSAAVYRWDGSIFDNDSRLMTVN